MLAERTSGAHASRAVTGSQRRADLRPAPSVDGARSAVYSPRMRLSDRKIDSLSEKLVRWLESQSDVELLGDRAVIRTAIAEEFVDEREQERKLDEEVDRILEQNAQRMRSEGVDTWVMRKKVRAQLARDRGLVL
jgi:hypothetical protein